MDYILVIWNPGQVPDGFHCWFLLISLQPGKEGGEGEGEHDGGHGVGEHEAEHQAGVRVLQDVSILRNEADDADGDNVDGGGDQKAERAKKLICEDWNLVS